MSKLQGATAFATPKLSVVKPMPAVKPVAAQKKEAAMSTLLKSGAMYWIVVIGSGVILLWAWAIAIEKIIQGKTVLLG